MTNMKHEKYHRIAETDADYARNIYCAVFHVENDNHDTNVQGVFRALDTLTERALFWGLSGHTACEHCFPGRFRGIVLWLVRVEGAKDRTVKFDIQQNPPSEFGGGICMRRAGR